jgi:hypothetical protein
LLSGQSGRSGVTLLENGVSEFPFFSGHLAEYNLALRQEVLDRLRRIPGGVLRRRIADFQGPAYCFTRKSSAGWAAISIIAMKNNCAMSSIISGVTSSRLSRVL